MNYHSTQINDIADRVVLLHNKSSRRILISLGGVPGSGKSTIAARVSSQLNEKGLKTTVLPMDGFHYTRAELAAFPNAQEAIFRRGAPFTFNARAFVDLLGSLRGPNTVYAPSFDHKLKDPRERDIVIAPEVQVVIVEGNYVSLSDDVWTEISDLMDETWFCEASLETVRERIISRHIEAGLASSREEAIERVDGSDLVNARYILDRSKGVDVYINNE